MSWTLLRGTLHQRRVSMFWFSCGLVLYGWLIVWFWPQMGNEFAALIDDYPQEVLALFGGTDLSFASLGGYLQIEYLGLMWMLIAGSAVILFASKAFAGEVATGTMEFVLTQPISRVRLALTRIVALAGYTALLSAATFLPIQFIGPQYEIKLSTGMFWTLFALGMIFMLAIGGIAMLLSALSHGGGIPGAATAGLLAAMWALDLIAGVSGVAEFFDPVNLVSYWQPGNIINGGAVASGAWLVYAGVAVVTLIASIAVFARRDVA